MKSLKVEDVFSKKVVSVDKDDKLSTCLHLFEDKMSPVLIVTDKKGEYKGVIARRWVNRSKLDPATTKVSTLMRSAPTVKVEESVIKAARLIIESEVRQLPVYRGYKMVGIISDEDIIHNFVLKNWGNTKINEIMTKNPSVVEEDDSLGAVLNLFREKGISHAPVVENGKLKGVISIHDFIEHIFRPKYRSTTGEFKGEKIRVLSAPVKSIMSKPAITVLRNMSLREAERNMHEFDISCLVVAQKGRPIGIVTKRDFLEPIIQMAREERRMTVQFSVRDLDIDELQRGYIMNDFNSFAERYKETLGKGTLFIYMKSHGTNFKGDQLVHCRLQLRLLPGKGSFFSSAEGFGVETTFKLALDRLDKQILRSKDMEHDPAFARTYLRRIRFPFTEF